MKVDIGHYNADPELYQKLIDELYADNPPITLPPEYGAFFKNDLLRLFIRLARYKFVARLIKRPIACWRLDPDRVSEACFWLSIVRTSQVWK